MVMEFYYKYGLDLNGGDANAVANVTHANPLKFISQGYLSLCPWFLEMGDGQKIRFWEDT